MRPNRSLFALVLVACAALPGCVIVQVGVTNPIPGLTTVAVAPFFNQSSERAVDGRLFAAAYYAELQKVPGFQVVPNDVTERAILENGLRMSGPQDALELARLLNVDAVVIGSITDYTPYPPPRLGLQVSWYSPYPWEFAPGIQDDMFARRRFNAQDHPHSEDCDYPEHYGEEEGWERVKRVGRGVKRTGKHAVDVIRGQSPESVAAPAAAGSEGARVATSFTSVDAANTSTPGCPPAESDECEPGWKAMLLWTPRAVKYHYKEIVDWATATDERKPDPTRPPPGPPISRAPRDASGQVEQIPRVEPTRTSLGVGLPKYPGAFPQPEFDPTKPFMSYTRLFDGADADLQATLRDYLEVRGDPRSGGWEGYLNRSEDFIRFTSHLMIVEMLTLHGGEGKRRIVFKHRKYQ